ncbi:hypothetical protein CHLRE_08g372716v5 [Chlamydomonas reinhardtii]|uniref:Uncharacterized protein n=1 Tax=Chlamydomonas reinhardtii TaxID=3055 RepID=A0A2K3DHB1_CHLRE|nr:uncharacterized protein CHLRE_08g372716v5 [Chlamydomonas reinhardtii]PNW79932.1 hypothetical protein CHLRE_08g372716v5 [Chlamydomonas reinhardtii]
MRAVSPWPSRDFVAHWGRPEPWRCLTLPQRRRLLSLAASSGDAGSLEAALAHCGCTGFEEPAASAALAGRVSACDKLVSLEPSTTTCELFSFAAQAGQLEVCRWYWRRREELQQMSRMEAVMQLRHACVMACRGGHEELVSWLEQQQQQLEQQPLPHQAQQQQQQQQQQELSHLNMAGAAAWRSAADLRHASDMALAAAEGGLAELCARWAETAGPDQLHPAMLACKAALGCNLAGLQQLASFYYDLSPGIRRVRNHFMAQCAAASPTPDWKEKVDWATQQPDPAGVPQGPEAPQDPVAGVPQGPGDEARTTRLLSEVAQTAFFVAAGFPDWHLRLQHVRSRGLLLLDAVRMTNEAAAAGNTAALTWLLDQPEGQGLAASDELVWDAAAGGHVPVLECLRARGLVFDITHATAAAAYGRGEALRWMAGAVAGGSVAAWSEVWRCATDAGVDLSTLRLLHEQRGAAVDLAAVAAAGSVEAVEWAFGLLEQEQEHAAGMAGGGTAGASVDPTGAGAGVCAGSAAPSPASLEALWAAARAGNWATASWLLLVLRRRGQDCCHELLPFFGRKVESKVWGRARDSELAALRWLEGELERAAAR